MDWRNIWWDTWPREQYIVRHAGNILWATWPHGQHELIRHIVWHSTIWTVWFDTTYGETHDNMGNILCDVRPREQYMVSQSAPWIDTTDDTLDHVGDTLWARPHGQHELVQHMMRHSDHMDTTSWCDTLWDTWATYCETHDHMGNTRPHGQYICETHDHMGNIYARHHGQMYSMNWYTIWWDTDHVSNILWATRPCGQHELIRHIAIHSITWSAWIDTAYCDTLGHTGNILWATRPHRQYIVSHSATQAICFDTLGHTSNILWDTMTTWAIYRDTLWPHGQYIVSHSATQAIYCEPLGHTGNMFW